jgi:hypothetical protein
MIESLRRQLHSLIGAAAALDGILGETDPASLLPLDVAQAAVDLADLCSRLERLADRLANAAIPRSEQQGDSRAGPSVPNVADVG